MKSKLLLILATLTLALGGLTGTALADEAGGDVIGHSKKFGLGVGGGSHTYGFAPKYYLTTKDAVQGVIGLNPGVYGSEYQIGVDYLRELGTWVNLPPGRLWWGLGAGVEAYMYTWWHESYTSIGIAGIFEVGWHFKNFPLELTASLRPTFYLGDHYYSGFYPYGGGAARWYF